jgi:hypothetical protein
MRGNLMQYLGVMRGSGVLTCGEEQMGRADYDIDGFLTRPGEVVGSGEIRMSPEALNNAFGRQGLQLTTDDGRILEVRFSGKRNDPASEAAHADISGQLPGPSEWRR